VISIISFSVHSIAMLSGILSSFYIFFKSIRYTATTKHKIAIIAWCLLWAVLYGYVAVSSLIPLAFIRPLACFVSVIFAFLLTKQKFETVVSAYLLAFGISLSLYYIATAIISFVSMFLLSSEIVTDAPIDYNQPIYLFLHTLIFTVQVILSILIFRIRRFRKGFPFIFGKFQIVLALFFTGTSLILVTRVNRVATSEGEIYSARFINIAGVIIVGGGIYILIRRLIKMFQAKKAQQNTADHYERLYLEEKAKNEELLKIDKEKSSAIHNITDRLKAMESAVVGTPLSEALQDLQSDWDRELDKIKGKTALPSTNIPAIDNLFEYYARQFKAEKIAFNVMINGSIKYMIDNVIRQGDLETLIVNHLNDAKKAVNASDGSFRSITAVIGVSNSKEHYEFTVLDSGIPFEVDTLVRLGAERVTTHAESGGGGIGFETTFATMRETGASLIINEQEQSDVDYSKSVTIRFDGENRYIIETYRADEFPESDRFTVNRNTSPQHSVV
jgi:signal transduction histidine kinase